MLKAVGRAITSRAAGPIAVAVAVALAVALAVSTAGWEAKRAGFERRIAELTRQGERSQALMKAQLAACHAAADPQRRVTEATFADARANGGGAQRLLERQPEGIDACARMESADQAVLSNLK
jgi:hypothetical protein